MRRRRVVELTPELYEWAAGVGRKFCGILRLKDDCAQIARIALWRVSQRFDGRGEFKAYAWKAIRYRVLDFLRKRVFGKSPNCSRLARLRRFEFTHSLDDSLLEGLLMGGAFSTGEDLFRNLEVHDLVTHLLTRCDSRERFIIEAWMGGRTFESISRDLKVTRARVHQIWKALLKRLRGVALARCA